MLKSRLNLATLLAVAAMSGLRGAARAVDAAREPRGRMTIGKRPGRKYPEQSSRQELRGFRRARGGPGLVLAGGEYQVREVA